ncbi:MAG TPA: polysaccharide biosynthesis/export family protein [Longimicrobiales bacterium]|nr:polysaccharide biosynthesis/export family protein [Longimicrobiales bacterium]
MTELPGKVAYRWPQGLIALLAFICMQGPTVARAQTAVDQSQAAAVANYVVQAGDVLSVLIWGWPAATDKLEGRFPIESNGRVYLPVIGAVEVAGKTTERVQAELRQRLNAEQQQAVIVIEPLFAVAINGEVRVPNVYDFRPGQTAFDAITRAGGYTDQADRKKMLLVREGNAQQLEAGDASALAAQLAQLPLKSGDRIQVHRRGRISVQTWLNILQTAIAAVTLYTLLSD